MCALIRSIVEGMQSAVHRLATPRLADVSPPSGGQRHQQMPLTVIVMMTMM